MPCDDAGCCDPTDPTEVELFDRPPCFTDTDCWTWESPYTSTPRGTYQGSPRFHPESPIHCRRESDDSRGIDLRLTGSPSILEQDALAASSCLIGNNGLRKVLESNGQYSLTSLPVPTSAKAQDCVTACTVVLQGATGDTETGCARSQTATITNAGCYPMEVDVEFEVLGLTLGGAAANDPGDRAQVELVPTLAGVVGAARPVSCVAGGGCGVYSGVVRLASVVVPAGGTYTAAVQPQMRFSNVAGPTMTVDVNWGDLCLALRGRSQITAATIGALEVSA